MPGADAALAEARKLTKDESPTLDLLTALVRHKQGKVAEGRKHFDSAVAWLDTPTQYNVHPWDVRLRLRMLRDEAKALYEKAKCVETQLLRACVLVVGAGTNCPRRLESPGEVAMAPTIPHDVERQYEGQWVAWDTEANLVVASGDSMRQVIERAKDHADRTGHLMWYHHVVRKDAVVVGGIW